MGSSCLPPVVLCFFRLVSWLATPHKAPLTLGGGWVELLVWVAVVWFLLAVVVPPSCLFFVLVVFCVFVCCLSRLLLLGALSGSGS